MIPLLFLIVVAGIAVFQIETLSKRMEKNVTETVPIVMTSKQLQQEISRVQNFLLLASLSKDNEDEMAGYLDKVDDAVDRFETSVDKYKSYVMPINVEKLRTELIHSWEQLIGPISEAKKLLIEKKFSQGKELVKDKIKPELNLMSDIVKNIEFNNAEMIEQTKKEGTELARKAKIYAITGASLAWLLSLSISFVVATFISKALARISSNLSKAGDQVGLAATKIASSSNELSHATTEQAASLQETSSSLEEISSMINANTENAKQSSIISEQSQSTAERGKVVVDHMIQAIVDISTSNTSIMNQIDETNNEIENIVKIINEIGNKTKVINDIVFQTKLLSFNASVEAARAGEQGKGFAVVAEEVGNLAAMSGAAALEITNMLDRSIKQVEEIVKDSKMKIGKLVLNGKEKVEIGTRVAHECGDVLSEIVSSVGSVSKMVTEISSASQEQAQGVQEITKAIAQLDQVTQQNTANSADSANAAATLSSQAEMLNSLVQNLAQTIDGSTSKAT